MNIKQTLTLAVIALTAACSAYCGEPKQVLTRSSTNAAVRHDEAGERGDRRGLGRQFAQADKPASPQNSALKPREVLTSATEKLKTYSSIRANITEKVTMQQHNFTAKGSYLQGQNLQLRMEFSVELGAQKGSLLEVCDGQVLWARHDLGGKDQTQITRRDVRQILDASQKYEQRLKTPDEKLAHKSSIVADLGIGGLPALLAAFAKDFDFKKVAEGKIEDRDVLILEGSWNSKYREMWLGEKAKDKNPPSLPPHIPDSVRLSLDKETEFPRRIEFLKQIPGQTIPSPLMTVDFTKFVPNGKVLPDDFVFIPPDRPQPIDVTQMYLQQLAPPKSETKKATAAPAEKGDKAAKKDAS